MYDVFSALFLLFFAAFGLYVQAWGGTSYHA